MKTAEQWKQQWPGDSSQGCITMLEFIAAIQDDAHLAGYLAGMTEAVEIATNLGVGVIRIEYPHNAWKYRSSVQQAILTARDAKALAEKEEK